MKRIQRKRKRQWRMPENTVYVGRPSIYGNPFTVKKKGGKWHVVNRYFDRLTLNVFDNEDEAWEEAVLRYRAWFFMHPNWPELLQRLKGKNLACWCPMHRPCHADVLIELVQKFVK